VSEGDIELSPRSRSDVPLRFLEQVLQPSASHGTFWVLNRAPLGGASKRKGGLSVMRNNFNPATKAMIGASQDRLLSARPR
jgi:hypothetical protein